MIDHFLSVHRPGFLTGQQVTTRRTTMPIMSRDEITGFEATLDRIHLEAKELRHALAHSDGARERYTSAVKVASEDLTALKTAFDEADEDKARDAASVSNA